MLDPKRLRNDFDAVKEQLSKRNEDISELDSFEELDRERRDLIQETEELKQRRNTVSDEIAAKKKNKEDADELIAEMRDVSGRVKKLDEQIREKDERLQQILLSIPNVPHETVPVGEDESDNEEVRVWGETPVFDFALKPHWELGVELNMLDAERAAKVTGSRFMFYKGAGARLERALIQFMMDLHSDEHGYEELIPPYMVNRESMTGTGQLPKFEEDAFQIREEDYFLVPTAEVPVTNMHREEIFAGKELPKAYTAFSACFRSEAGSAGRDTRGLIRQHQFNKVELVRFTTPEDSYEELEALTGHAEKVLQLLELPYRVMNMCTGDLGFTAAKKYDIEVWLPSYEDYKEISSCSNFEDFQARRANIRFKRNRDAKTEFVHTLNGSGLALGRTVAAIMENHQQEDGSIKIPEVLRGYMGNKEYITAK
ncbi:serine--tRNA ligase [Marinococcus sp. PL1-022]|uniref:serine--tRNA ligase n=1 Tax=Marinococcus sp. PL1-022 TaxID=3095363 RepID=UPI0029C5A865|nr:serine--tRNA ligase [Marinococcus sp. PL1-022]MDX6154369.1 serine--tRNA ligase [Marinococcus sp. PL1-022]